MHLTQNVTEVWYTWTTKQATDVKIYAPSHQAAAVDRTSMMAACTMETMVGWKGTNKQRALCRYCSRRRCLWVRNGLSDRTCSQPSQQIRSSRVQQDNEAATPISKICCFCLRRSKNQHTMRGLKSQLESNHLCEPSQQPCPRLLIAVKVTRFSRSQGLLQESDLHDEFICSGWRHTIEAPAMHIAQWSSLRRIVLGVPQAQW